MLTLWALDRPIQDHHKTRKCIQHVYNYRDLLLSKKSNVRYSVKDVSFPTEAREIICIPTASIYRIRHEFINVLIGASFEFCDAHMELVILK